METIVAIVMITTILYILVKIIEMKYVHKEMRPVKELIRDAAIVGASAFVSTFAVFSMSTSMNGFFNAVTDTNTIPVTAPVFTDNPGF